MKNKTALIPVFLMLMSGYALAQNTRPLIGGRCDYDKIKGTCEIVSVAKTDESIRQLNTGGGPGYEGYAVIFKFKPLAQNQQYSERWVDRMEEILTKEYTLQLTNSWYPGEKFLEKYEITQAKEFNCTLGLIKNGTCSPVVFEFADINTSDYFETKMN